MGTFRLQLSDAILDLTSRVLSEDFHWRPADVLEARTRLLAISQHVSPHVVLDVVKRDPDDNRVLECSQASGSEYIVTGDKDLLHLGVYAGAGIISPTQFLEVLRQRTW